MRDRERLAREKERAARGATPPDRDPFGPRAGSPGGTRPGGQKAFVFSGLNQAGLGPNGRSPPDTTGAAGPSHYLELVNSSIAVYNKADLSQVDTASLRIFTQHPTGLESLFDPQIIWDPQSSRWYYLVARRVGPTGSLVAHLAFGWSKTGDPTDLVNGWCHQDIDTEDVLDDYAKLGDNDTHLVFGSN
ncbi:MAG: hypothetical protein LC713_00970, partial [Actinobacteria bacterium]|nr:hypothetical protein [Actinomycetota bacterium]